MTDAPSPFGPKDEGPLRLIIDVNRTSKKIVIEFGKPVVAIGMTKEEAETLVRVLVEKIELLRVLR